MWRDVPFARQWRPVVDVLGVVLVVAGGRLTDPPPPPPYGHVWCAGRRGQADGSTTKASPGVPQAPFGSAVTSDRISRAPPPPPPPSRGPHVGGNGGPKASAKWHYPETLWRGGGALGWLSRGSSNPLHAWGPDALDMAKKMFEIHNQNPLFRAVTTCLKCADRTIHQETSNCSINRSRMWDSLYEISVK